MELRPLATILCVAALLTVVAPPGVRAAEPVLPRSIATARGWMDVETEYLPGVVEAVAGPSASADLRRAVAVAARTRLVAFLADRGRTAQVPLTASGLSAWRSGAGAASRSAAAATRGLVLTRAGRPIPVPSFPVSGGSPSRPRGLAALEGKWVYLWKLRHIHGGDVRRIVDTIRSAGIIGVAIKVHNGTWTGEYDTPEMDHFLDLCRDEGIRVAFWGYVYLNRDPRGEARAAGLMVKKHADLVDAYLIDAEGEAKGQHANARVFAAELAREIGSICPIGLASYRFPSYHRELPWKELRAICQFDSPQVYYRNGDPVANLERSLREFGAMSPALPFFPAGDMYHEYGIRPTPEAVRRYLEACHDHPSVRGTLMWTLDQLEKTPELFRVFAAFEWPVENAGSDWRSILRRTYGSDVALTQTVAPPPPAPEPTPDPDVPAGLSPDAGRTIGGTPVVLAWRGPRASAHRVQVEFESSGAFRPYYTWTVRGANGSFSFWPVYDRRRYRWRVQAETARGWSEWSVPALFFFDRAAVPAPAPPPTPGPSGPTGLAPDRDARESGSSVQLRWNPVSGAAGYEVQIEYLLADRYRTYYTYRPAAAGQRFWPSFEPTTYRFRVRARRADGEGPWSEWATFRYDR